MEETPAPTPTQDPYSNPSPTPATCWSNVVKNQKIPNSQSNPASNPSVGVFVESCKSSKGIAVAVVDANAIIEGGEKLNHCADKFVSVSEVMDEIRDPVSRHRLAFIPFSVQTMEPSPESLNKVIKFARATGDLQTLSDVDLKLIALTFTLEAQIHGTEHLRDCPPPVHTVNVKRFPEKDLPGWGSNVPNLKDWEALEHQAEDKSNLNSRILPLRDLSLNVASDAKSENQEEGEKECHEGRPRRYLPKKKEVKIEGKKMVAEGVDASVGELDDNADDWMPAVSRSTHRRFLRRKARREYYQALSDKDKDEFYEENEIAEEKNAEKSLSSLPYDTIPEDNSLSDPKECNESVKVLSLKDKDEFSEERGMVEERNNEESLSSVLNEMKLEDDSLRQNEEVDESVEGDHDDTVSEELDHVELSNAGDDDSSEQSWMLRSLSESSVACITSDFAMQNVLLQMGLRLLAPGGMQIRKLHRWILKCHACYTVTAEIGRIFCPKCGNGGTLRKVAVTVGENGIVLAARRPRITLRGTKFSLPLPQGGRDAITKNLILREDQLPKKFLHPKTKKKGNKQDDDLFTSDSVFIHHTDKRAPLQPPVRQALAVFSGRRNPNDNHYSRSMHK